MNKDWDGGEQLWQLLPAVYRKPPADTPPGGRPPLQDYLAAFGVVLDQIRGTLLQLQHDNTPEASQEWLLNYLAYLLDAHPLAPHLEGRRAEIGHAIRWRQRKGTWGAALETASVVGNLGRGGPLAGETVGTERALAVVVQEGWQRVAITPRVDQPIWPDDALGDAWRHDPKNKALEPTTIPPVLQGANDRLHLARHPNLPSATIDFGHACRALASQLVEISGEKAKVPVSAISRHTDFCGTDVDSEIVWEIAQPHGLPCAISRYPDWRQRGGSYEDFTRRTVDLRAPDWRVGHCHPKRVLLFTAPPHGFFSAKQESLVWNERWSKSDEPLKASDFTSERDKPLAKGDFMKQPEDPADKEVITVDGVFQVRWQVAWIDDKGILQARPEFDWGDVSSPGETLIKRTIEQHFHDASSASAPFLEVIEDALEYQGSSEFRDGTRCIRKTYRSQRLLVEGRACTPPRPKIPEYRMSVCARTDEPLKVTGNIDLSAKPGVTTVYHFANLAFVGGIKVESVQVILRKSAAKAITVRNGGDTTLGDRPRIDASDSLLGKLHNPDGWVRLEYCTVLSETSCKRLDASDCILVGEVASAKGCIRYTCAPKLDPALEPQIDTRKLVRTSPLFWSDTFGESGCGVLHPATVSAISIGAEDGGEMGANHHRHHCRHRQAIVEKARRFLAVGLEPVVVVDPALCEQPPKVSWLKHSMESS